MKVGQHRRKSERHSENTEVAEMLHGFPKTLQFLVPNTCKAQLPLGSCITPAFSP